MEELQKKPLSRYMHDRIYLGDDTWLLFDRVRNYNTDDDNAVVIKYIDNLTQTQSILGTLYHNKWIFPENGNGNLLWKYIKQHSKHTKRILKNLKEPLEDFRPFLAEWQCFKRRFKIETVRIKRKLIHS
jgi:hypothetical protein